MSELANVPTRVLGSATSRDYTGTGQQLALWHSPKPATSNNLPRSHRPTYVSQFSVDRHHRFSKYHPVQEATTLKLRQDPRGAPVAI